MIDPRTVDIPDSVLELVPVSVILEICILPFAIKGTLLTIFCKPDFDEQEKVRFILGRHAHEVQFLPVDESTLREAIEMRLPLSEGTIENCKPQFRFQCPKEWSSLQVIADDRIRFCSACLREVYWCNTESAATELGRQGKCVAIRFNGADTLGLIDFSEDYDE